MGHRLDWVDNILEPNPDWCMDIQSYFCAVAKGTSHEILSV